MNGAKARLLIAALLLTLLAHAIDSGAEDLSPRLFVGERGASLVPDLGHLRSLGDAQLLVLPSAWKGPTPAGGTEIQVPPGRETFLIDLDVWPLPNSLLESSAEVLWSGSAHAILALEPRALEELDRIRNCKERLRYIPPAASRSWRADRRLVDPVLKLAIVDAVSQARLSEIVQELSGAKSFLLDGQTFSIDSRYTFGTEIGLSADYLQDRFFQAGYSVERQVFSVGAGSAENVIAIKPGTTMPEEIIVIGAHFDSRSEISSTLAPGAEDNASGTAIVLHLSEVLASVQTDRTIHFVCFGAEEQGLFGSQYYVGQLAANGWTVTHSLVMDMVAAWISNYKVVIEGEPDWEELMSLFEDNVAAWAEIGSRKDYVSFGSDHVPFQAAGIPCFLAIDWDWDIYPHYHRSTDTWDKLDISLGWRIGRAMVGTLSDLAGARSGPSTASPPSPQAFVLGQNRPNPFNPRTEIPLALRDDGLVRLGIYDVAGRRVRHLVDGWMDAGEHVLRWDGTDDLGRTLPSGLYLYRLRTPAGDAARRMVLIR
jgi:hypothetical protein